jgi:hypothetical protein
MRGSRPGERRGGRQKGTPNKMTVDVKTAIIDAFHALGGADYLCKVGRENAPVFCALLGKTLPKDIKAEVAHTLSVLIEESMKPTKD